jgi:hypothetical protein
LIKTDAFFLQLLKNELEFIDKIPDIGIYIFSLSARENMLSQWRGYCPDGAGFSIGFDSRKLRELSNENKTSVH